MITLYNRQTATVLLLLLLLSASVVFKSMDFVVAETLTADRRFKAYSNTIPPSPPPRRAILHSQGKGDGHPRLLCFSKAGTRELRGWRRWELAPRIVVNYIMHSNRDPRRVRARQRLDIRGVADVARSSSEDPHHTTLFRSLGSRKIVLGRFAKCEAQFCSVQFSLAEN